MIALFSPSRMSPLTFFSAGTQGEKRKYDEEPRFYHLHLLCLTQSPKGYCLNYSLQVLSLFVMLSSNATSESDKYPLFRGNSAAAEVEQPELHFDLSRVDCVFDADSIGMRPFWRRRKPGGKPWQFLPAKDPPLKAEPAVRDFQNSYLSNNKFLSDAGRSRQIYLLLQSEAKEWCMGKADTSRTQGLMALILLQKQLAVVNGNPIRAFRSRSPYILILPEVYLPGDVHGGVAIPLFSHALLAQEVRVVMEESSPRVVELSSFTGREPSELWMTQSPDSVQEGVAAKREAAGTDNKSQRPIPWCLDNPLKFPWLKRGQK